MTKYFFYIVLFLVSIGVHGQETFFDSFSAVSYSNNNGSQNFSSNWTEQNDDGSPSAGRILITGNRLRFNNLDNRAIYRFVPLAGASSATLTLDYDATSRGNEALQIFIYNTDTATFNLIATINTSNTGSISYNLSAAEIASNPAIYINGADTSWGGSETIFLDNILFTATFSPQITIDDISIDENAGTATFTATHIGADASGPFAVNFTTVDGTADSGIDYTSTSGTISFSGTSGGTDTVTIPILNNAGTELDETFILQLTSSSDGSVDISDTATATITEPNSPRPYEERYAMNVGGNFKVLANTNLECVSGCPATPTTNNPSVVMGYADVDADSGL
ncbi:Calx-beta domain-containing protein [Croceitalea marina]|uniref:Calx-beta domain-containing protein n=1 Tax=Croceitalea marina TaxID=1775166 RepID=A0ABW5N2A3_9FLAO